MSADPSPTPEEREAGDSYDRLQNEAELARIQKEVRDQEREYYLYKEETKRRLLRDAKEIELLEKENREHRLVLSNAEADCYVKKDETTLSELHSKLNEEHQVQQDIRLEKDKHEEGKVQIAQMEKKIKNYRRNVAGLKGRNIKRKIAMIEGALDKANKDFAKGLETNKRSRQEIECQRRDQKMFFSMYKKMESRLKSLKDDVCVMEEICKHCFRQREDYVIKRRSLEERETREQEEFVSDLHNLHRVIAHETNFREFIKTKNKDIMHRQIAAEEQRREQAWAARLASAQEHLAELDAAFERIVEVTHEENIDIIVNHFLDIDAEMYSIFSFICEMERQAGELEYELQKIRDEKEALANDLECREVAQHGRLKELELIHQRVQEESEHAQTQLTRVTKELDELVARAQETYVRLSEKDNTLCDALEESGGQVTDRNALIYLAELEGRANKLMMGVHGHRHGDDEEEVDIKEHRDRPEDLCPPNTPDRFIVDTPDIRSDSDSEDDKEDVLPLTPEEIKKQLVITN